VFNKLDGLIVYLGT